MIIYSSSAGLDIEVTLLTYRTPPYTVLRPSLSPSRLR
jgi:hypothetical protein